IPTVPVLTDNTFCGAVAINDITQDGWVWYNSADATEALANTFTISETTTLYVENTNENCASERVAITITINSIPTVPVLTENTFCGAITINDITQNGWVWYNSADATEALANTFTISETTTLYVENTNENCASERVAITITINTIPTVPVLTDNTFCGAVAINDITQDGWVWYNSADATEALANTFTINETATLYVEVNNETCSSSRSVFIITIHNTPAPNVNTSYNFCLQTNPTLLDLNIAGDSIVYYESLQSTLPLSEETLLEHNHTYYISQIINGCESLRVATTVYLFNTPAPTANSAQEFCFGSTIGDIAINGQNIKWYESLDSTTPLAISAPLSEGVYYATQTLNNCESIERKAVVITLTEAPILETTTLAICSNTTLIDIVLDEYSYSELSWYVSEHSNIALPPNYMVNNQQLLYVKINSSLCTSFKQAISFETLPIVPIPNINNQVICGSGTIADLVVFGAENTIIEWFASAHSNVVLSPNTPLTTGTYYVSQKIGGCSSYKKAVFVKVISKTAPIIGSLAVCEGTLLSEVNLPYLPNATYEWYVSPTSTNQLSGNTVIQTGYYYIARNQENCISERRQVFIQVNQIPNAPTGNTNQLIELPATVADIVMNENNIIWYNSYEDALDNIQPLSPTTALHQNTILYGVIVNANGCRSLPTAVSINVYLNTPELDLDALRIYPNPVNDWLNISYKENVKSVIIYDLTGRLIYRKDINSPEIKIDMSGFAKTTYLLKVSTNTESSTIKIIKK
ncbi:MAG TPA: T9SS type A sorting domain-containing protein, partial [Flavobacterium sp.]|nr:T9SS type A sorting domain-containing protein [Flavobacterium sp.]